MATAISLLFVLAMLALIGGLLTFCARFIWRSPAFASDSDRSEHLVDHFSY